MNVKMRFRLSRAGVVCCIIAGNTRLASISGKRFVLHKPAHYRRRQRKEVEWKYYRVCKSYLVTSLAAAIETGQLKVSPGCTDAKELRDQLYDFEVQISERGNVSFNTSAGHHDDLVLSTGIAWLVVPLISGASFVAQPVELRR
jgi:hypothetical protein